MKKTQRKNQRRKTCFVITSHVHYARNKLVLKSLKKHPGLLLRIVVGGSAILPNYGDALASMKRDGFSPAAKIIMNIEGGTPAAMAKTAGLGVCEFASVFERLRPDLVILRGDRYEVLSAAVASSYLNIPIVHIEGGDLSGTIDESVRHAITKLSHIHFATNADSLRRIIKMGERPDYVFNVGLPEAELTAEGKFRVHNRLINYLGVGDVVDINKNFLMIMHHPVTTEYGENRKNTEILLEAVRELNTPAIWFWPNADAGTDEVSKAIRVFRENTGSEKIRFIKYLPPEEFYGLLGKTACLIGNSSSAFKECSVLGTPAVNIGTRQDGRLKSPNVINVSRYVKFEIKKSIERQISNGRYERNFTYYKPGTAKTIASLAASLPLYRQKKFYENE